MYSRRQMRLALATMITMLAIMVAGASADTYYVDGSVGSSGDGSDWDHAFKTIQEGIDACNTGSSGDPDLVKVAGSTSGLTYDENIVLGSCITLEAGWDPASDTRDHETYVTTIDGNAAGSVVTISSKTDVTIDGFTITDGSASYGGGIYSHASSPTLNQCTITGNTASDRGVGIYCYGSSPTLNQCTIAGNTGAGRGTIYCDSSSPTLNHCTISSNTADYGGGIFCYRSSPTLADCMITGK